MIIIDPGHLFLVFSLFFSPFLSYSLLFSLFLSFSILFSLFLSFSRFSFSFSLFSLSFLSLSFLSLSFLSISLYFYLFSLFPLSSRCFLLSERTSGVSAVIFVFGGKYLGLGNQMLDKGDPELTT